MRLIIGRNTSSPVSAAIASISARIGAGMNGLSRDRPGRIVPSGSTASELSVASGSRLEFDSIFE